jgi:2-polyprenyl-3-methyl-5-hydroxy-6-metoxy-1,4-benzoquinol methylase
MAMDQEISAPTARPRVLVAIANYGTSNDPYLARLVQEYKAMPFDLHIVILSNLKKQREGTENLVGLPTKNPWSLPFAHKKVFAERIHQYDLFVYSEDDILITEHNLRAFLEVSSILEGHEIAGFFRIEKGPCGNVSYPDVHSHFHWMQNSIKSRGKYTLAAFTNEHSACYAITQSQLRKALASGGFLVGPHEWKYDLLCTAATDPYTQCGFQKLIPISHFDDFVVEHLSHKYIGTFGINGPEMCRQIRSLMQIDSSLSAPASLFKTETQLRQFKYSKSYYEPSTAGVIALIPEGARSVLSIGCGSGATEIQLVEKGLRVVAVPLDSIICGNAAQKGVEMVKGDLRTARAALDSERFDCILFSNVLHLVPDPAGVLSSFQEMLLPSSVVIIPSPNMAHIRNLWETVRDAGHLWNRLGYEHMGVHFTSPGKIQRWCRKARLRTNKVIYSFPRRMVGDHVARLIRSLLASEFVIVAQMDGSKNLVDRQHF